MSILPQPAYPTGTVVLKEPPVTSPWPIITDEARTAWFEQQHSLHVGYRDDHGVVVGWYEEAWERVNDRPAQPWVRAITFSPSCWDGACWECEWAPEACACGHHAPWSCAPAGPVVAADPLPAVAAFLGIAKPAPEAEPAAEEPAAEEPAPVAEPEPAAGEPASATNATAVLLAVAAEQAAVNETAAPEATAVLPVTEAPAEAVAVVETDGGETDE